MVSYLFYDSLFAMLLSPLVWFGCYKLYSKVQIDRRQQRLAEQFKDLLKCFCGSFLAGYSPENALREAQRELTHMHGKESDIVKELDWMNQSVLMNQPLEKLLEDFGMRSHLDDIMSFAEVFRFAKRRGGNLVEILDSTCRHLCLKQETQRDLKVSLAQKKLEQNVMNIIPLGILGYFRIASPEHLEKLYGNLFGVVFMSICLGIYLAAIFLSIKMTRIEV